MPESATKHVDVNKPSQSAGNSDSHVAGKVLKDNRSADGFCLPMIGGQFEFDNGAFKQEKKQPVKAKGDGFNTSVGSVNSRYAKQAITEKITSSATKTPS